VPLQAICQPYKLAVDHPDGWGGYITLWEDRKEEPKIELVNGVNLAKAAYAIKLSAAAAAFTGCVDSAAASYAVSYGFCLLDWVFDSDAYLECADDAAATQNRDILFLQSGRFFSEAISSQILLKELWINS